MKPTSAVLSMTHMRHYLVVGLQVRYAVMHKGQVAHRAQRAVVRCCSYYHVARAES